MNDYETELRLPLNKPKCVWLFVSCLMLFAIFCIVFSNIPVISKLMACTALGSLVAGYFYFYVSNEKLRLVTVRADGSWSVRIAGNDIIDDYELRHATITPWWCWLILGHPESKTIRYFSLCCNQSRNDDFRRIKIRINATRSNL